MANRKLFGHSDDTYTCCMFTEMRERSSKSGSRINSPLFTKCLIARFIIRLSVILFIYLNSRSITKVVSCRKKLTMLTRDQLVTAIKVVSVTVVAGTAGRVSSSGVDIFTPCRSSGAG